MPLLSLFPFALLCSFVVCINEAYWNTFAGKEMCDVFDLRSLHHDFIQWVLGTDTVNWVVGGAAGAQSSQLFRELIYIEAEPFNASDLGDGLSALSHFLHNLNRLAGSLFQHGLFARQSDRVEWLHFLTHAVQNLVSGEFVDGIVFRLCQNGVAQGRINVDHSARKLSVILLSNNRTVSTLLLVLKIYHIVNLDVVHHHLTHLRNSVHAVFVMLGFLE